MGYSITPTSVTQHKMQYPLSRRWVFTLNNYTPAELANVRAIPHTYLCFGREVGASGTPHLQGFIIFPGPKRSRGAKQALGTRAHVEIARASSVQASEYCKKDGDYEEYGTLPREQGKRNDFAEFKQWVIEQPSKPTAKLVAAEFPSLFIRYGRCMEWIDMVYPTPALVTGDPRPWQQELEQTLDAEPDDRKIYFVIDPIGNIGKSWFIKYWFTKHPTLTQIFSIGKRDDLAYAICEAKRYFLFDIPRSQSEYLQYSVLEKLKDRLIFSPKYASKVKILASNVHVIVFMNEEPDYNMLSADRYEVIRPIWRL